jgi:hypothetical protein
LNRDIPGTHYLLYELNEVVGKTAIELTASIWVVASVCGCCPGAELLSAVSFLQDEGIISERMTIARKPEFFIIFYLILVNV